MPATVCCGSGCARSRTAPINSPRPTADPRPENELLDCMGGQDYQGDDVCQRCGACCAYFRVSFYWAEAMERRLPDSAVEQVTPLLACMAGSNQPQPRCHALSGEIGQWVSCQLYEQRP